MKRFSLGGTNVGDLEKRYVNEALNDNYIGPGRFVREVEEMCAEIHGLKHCVTLNSGQSAIMVALQGIQKTKFRPHAGPLDVAVPAVTYISTLAAVIHAGMRPVLVDVELGSYGMNPLALDKLLSLHHPSIDIVIPVHLFGKACDPRVQEVCEKRGVPVIEDAAEATCAPGMGWGTALTTSFFSNHLIAGGSGGAIMTNDPELDLACWKLINHGRAERFGNEDLKQTEDKFRFDTWGHSMKWSDVSAALVKAQLERREELIARRRGNASVLLEGLRSYEEEGLLTLPDPTDHCFMMFPILLSEGVSRENVVRYCGEQGIETRRMMPITDQPVVKNYFADCHHVSPTVADQINRYGFYVGCHPDLDPADMEEMVGILSAAVTQEVKV